jgi:PhnB protein
MPQNPPEGYGRVTPYLLYEDSDAAVDFLTSAFGFTEKYRMTDDEGRVNHAEVVIGGDGVVMLGTPGSDYKNPRGLGGKTQQIYVYVDDVDAHYERAKAAGAKITREPEDQFYGDRNYGVEDPEGHEWYFGTHVRDVSPEEMQAATAGASS